jgi:hypothetical protein
MKARNYITIILVMVAFTIGCAANDGDQGGLSAGQTEPGDGVDLTLTFGSIDAPLNLSTIKTFRLRIYPHTPLSENESTLFDSLSIHGCFAASGTDVRIQDLKAGEDRFVFYEGFSDEACSERVALGIRGGVTITGRSELQKKASEVSCDEDVACQTDVHPDSTCDCAKEMDTNDKPLPYCKGGVTGVCMVSAPVFIPLYEVGQFNKMPMPSDTLKAEAAQVSCGADTDCEGVHKASTCDQELGFCVVEGLFPFSPSRPRAFHTAQVTGTGQVMITGGFNRIHSSDVYYAGAPFFETFNPYTGLFETPAVQENYGGQNVGMHRSTLLGDDRVVISGGISELKIKYQLGDELSLRLDIPHEFSENCPDTACTNFSRNLMSANLETGNVVQGVLPYRVILHRSAYTQKGGGDYLLLSSGLTFSDAKMASPVNQHVLCNAADILADDPNTSCAMSENADTYPPRYTHAHACLVGGGAGEPCSEYMVFGGVDEGDPPGEVYSGTDDNFNSLLSFTDVTSLAKAHLSELARVETDANQPAKLYSFGGVKQVSLKNDNDRILIDIPPADILPQQVNVNLNEKNYSMTTAGMELKNLEDAGEIYRLFHTVSVLEGGRIMLAGGLGDDSLPTRDTLFFEEPATHALTYDNKIQLRGARFGHTATVIKHGILKGAVLVVGGFTVADKETGAIKFADGAELYIP